MLSAALTLTYTVLGGLMGLLGLMSTFILFGQGILVLRHSRALRARQVLYENIYRQVSGLTPRR